MFLKKRLFSNVLDEKLRRKKNKDKSYLLPSEAAKRVPALFSRA